MMYFSVCNQNERYSAALELLLKKKKLSELQIVTNTNYKQQTFFLTTHVDATRRKRILKKENTFNKKHKKKAIQHNYNSRDP